MTEQAHDEIADIMNEISSLQQGMADVVEQVPAPPESAESSGIAAISRVSEAKEEKRSTMSKSENAGELNMVISGEMTLKLNYQYAGQTVSIRFVDESLRVELTDGTEFKIPVRAAKKAA